MSSANCRLWLKVFMGRVLGIVPGHCKMQGTALVTCCPHRFLPSIAIEEHA